MPQPFKALPRIAAKIKQTLLESEGIRTTKTNYYLQDAILEAKVRLPIPRQNFKTERPTIVTFADDAPLLNWAHPCRYLLHDAKSGEIYAQLPAQFPPFGGPKPTEFSLFHESVVRPAPRNYLWDRIVIRPKLKFGGDRYAVLFSGMSNNRHTNDLEFLYRVLREGYQVPKGNIYVLNQDGSINYDGDPQPVLKWPGDQTAYRLAVTGKGSKADLSGVFDDLKKRLKTDDSLLIHTNNHGGHNGTESDLCCYPNWDSFGVTAFTDKLAELPKFRCLMVMMEQCHAGGFNNAVIAKSTAQATSIASACTELNNSIGGADFDPFARDWISAMNGHDPYGNVLAHNADTDGDGKISAREAFHYADSIHHPSDTPVFNDSNNGGACALGQDLFNRFRLPPEMVERLIKKAWPEPDPLFIDRQIASAVSELKKLEKKFGPRLNKFQQEIEKALGKALESAAQTE